MESPERTPMPQMPQTLYALQSRATLLFKAMLQLPQISEVVEITSWPLQATGEVLVESWISIEVRKGKRCRASTPARGRKASRPPLTATRGCASYQSRQTGQSLGQPSNFPQPFGPQEGLSFGCTEEIKYIPVLGLWQHPKARLRSLWEALPPIQTTGFSAGYSAKSQEASALLSYHLGGVDCPGKA